MRWLLYLFILTVYLASCKSKKQDKVDRPSTSLRLFKEGGDLYLKGFSLEFDDSLEAQKYYRQAIHKFNAAYNADTSDIELGIYLDELYARTGQFDSALIWSLRIFPFNYEKFSASNLTALSHNYRFMGEYYFYEGDSANGKKCFQLALKADPRQAGSLSKAISDIADKLYFKTFPNQEKKLKSINIDPCRYSLDMMRFGLSIAVDDSYIKEIVFPRKKFIEREKNCR